MSFEMRFESKVRDGVLILTCRSKHTIELCVRVVYKKDDNGKQPALICTKNNNKCPMTFAEIMEYVGIDFIMVFQEILESDVEKTSDLELTTKYMYKNGLGLMNMLYRMACEHNPAHASMQLFR